MGELLLKIKEKEPDPVYNDCSNTFNYTGNIVYPLINTVNLSEEERVFKITFTTTNKPIKIKVYLEEAKLYTSPFIGNTSNQAELDSFNIDNNYPLEIIENLLTLDVTINKSTTNRVLKIEVYAPLNSNDFEIEQICI